jgi:TonB family protein
MTKGQETPTGGFARAAENRSYARRKLTTMAYVELGQDNGGILLNLGEGGLAVQSALTLAGPEFPDIRFQLPNSKRWLVATGRVTWMSDSRTEAGIQFLDLRPETRAQIRRWVAVAGEESSVLAPPQTANLTDSQRSRESQKNGGNLGAPAMLGATAANGEEHAAVQNFRFNDYSMFSTEPSAEQVAVEPARNRWKSFALLAICLAILFFVLGASFGRYTFDQWLQPRTPELQKVPAPSGTAAVNSGTNVPETEQSQTQQKANEPSASQPSEEALKSNTSAEQDATGRQDQDNDANSDASGGDTSDAVNPEKTAPERSPKNSDNVAIAPNRIPEVERGKLRPPQRGVQPFQARPQSTYRGTAAQNDEDATHSILVNAPPPGSPAFFVNLTNEAVDASQWVATSATRSVWIAPRSSQSGYGPERVTIGRLISHSQPFYPQEARNQHLEGSVVLRATFGRTGTLLKVTAVSGPPVLTNAGVTAVREWRYAPTFIDGDPVETQADITMVFRLR